MTTLLAAALDYAARGWPVVPLHTWTGSLCTCENADCGSPAKHPRTRNGLHNATVDTDQITGWWRTWPEANIGLRTGDVFDVLDADGTTGIDAVVAFCAANDVETPFAAPCARTGGGGQHVLFLPTGIGNRAGILPKVDWRGLGGYIVAPPSLHASGCRYEWTEAGPAMDLWAAPSALRALLDPPRVQRSNEPLPPLRRANGSTPYGQAAMASELDELAHAAVGTRNHTLNTVAFNLYQLVGGGELVEGEVQNNLLVTALSIGLGQREAEATIGSARKAGTAAPRAAPDLMLVPRTSGALVTDGSSALAPIRVVETEPEPPSDLSSFLPPDLVEFVEAGDAGYQWVVEGVAEAADRIILTGVEGKGKSTLMRQMAVQLASGIHPFTHQPIEPVRVLYVDCENSERQTRRHFTPLVPLAPNYGRGNLRIHVVPDALEIGKDPIWQALALRVKAHEPHVIMIGPLYKMIAGDPLKEEPAKQLSDAFDRLRHLYSSVLLIEAHSPYPDNPRAKRLIRPYGASLWSRWPEFGIYIAPDGALDHWRGPRDERAWPSRLQRGTPWPWMPSSDQPAPKWDGPTQCMEAIVAYLDRHPGEEFSKRVLPEKLRAVSLNYREQTIREALELLAERGQVAYRKGPNRADLYRSLDHPMESEDPLDY